MTTSNPIAVRRLLLEPDDPEVCGPAQVRERTLEVLLDRRHPGTGRTARMRSITRGYAG